jgi:hypothetical protein
MHQASPADGVPFDAFALETDNEVLKLIPRLVEAQLRGADWDLFFPRTLLRTWMYAVHAVASDLEVERGRPRIPRHVESAVEALGCIWVAAAKTPPKNGDKNGSFGDFAQTFTPMLIESSTRSQITTAIRHLVALIQSRPDYLAIDSLADG